MKRKEKQKKEEDEDVDRVLECVLVKDKNNKEKYDFFYINMRQ